MQSFSQKAHDGWRRRRDDCSGQAFVEFVFVVIILAVMLFGLIDFGRAIYERQVITSLSREGANLAARGSGNSTEDRLTNAVDAVIASSLPLDFNAKGRVTVSAVTASNSQFFVLHQVSKGGMPANDAVSHLRTGTGEFGTMPVTTTPQIPQDGQIVYVTEIFYSFAPITPVGKLLNLAASTPLYDAAYF